MILSYKDGDIDDFKSVFDLNRLIFDEYWSKDVMLQSLQLGYDLQVCYQHKELIGYVLSQDILYETQIMQLAVKQQHRRLGVGNHLMQRLIQDKQGMEALMLEVRLSNIDAQHFYRDLNFAQVGQRPNYYKPTPTLPREDAILLRLPLTS